MTWRAGYCLAVFMGVQPLGMQQNLEAANKMCSLCKRSVTENVNHVLFECTSLIACRTAEWTTVVRSITLIPAWISNYIHYNVWDEITYPFPNFNICTVEVCKCVCNLTHYYGCDYLSMLVLKLIHVSIRGHRSQQAWTQVDMPLVQPCGIYVMCNFTFKVFKTVISLGWKLKLQFSHIEAETKWPSFCCQHFQIHFLEWTLMCFNSIIFPFSLKCVSNGPINNNQVLVQIMACSCLGNQHYLNQWCPSLLTYIQP